MKRSFWIWFFCSFLIGLGSTSRPVLAAERSYPLMRPDRETREKWAADYARTPFARIDPGKIKIAATPGSVDLLPHLYYVPAERDQGMCGNCWAWAGTGCMEIALDIDESTKDRLSIQYINSCETDVIGKPCCEGGLLSDVADFYSITKKAIPWSNTNAYWQDGDLSCDTPCSSIAKDPNYPIDLIEEERIETIDVLQETAINNIKNVLNQDKAVWFAFFLPDRAAWDDFILFWTRDAETAAYQIDRYRDIPYDERTGGGHAVLCVGYDDTDPDNSYWIMLNSWGTTAGRPNGLFRINMDMDYSTANPPYTSFYWQILNMDYSLMLNGFTIRDKISGSTRYTKDREVKIELANNGHPTEAGLAVFPDMTGAVWQTYNATVYYTLPEGDGAKTVYARLRNAAGRESNTLNSSIILATIPPRAGFFLNSAPARDNDYTTAKPVLTVIFSGAADLDEATIAMECDGTAISDGTAGGGRYDSFDPATKTVNYIFKFPLAPGAHDISISVTDLAGNSSTSELTEVTVSDQLAVESLLNSPNPFSGQTNIGYVLSQDADVAIRIYSVQGQLIKTLSSPAGGAGGRTGYNALVWDGTDESGRPVPNGTYFYRITVSDSAGRQITRQNKLAVLR